MKLNLHHSVSMHIQ